jgi:hypothetical protein
VVEEGLVSADLEEGLVGADLEKGLIGANLGEGLHGANLEDGSNVCTMENYTAAAVEAVPCRRARRRDTAVSLLRQLLGERGGGKKRKNGEIRTGFTNSLNFDEIRRNATESARSEF